MLPNDSKWQPQPVLLYRTQVAGNSVNIYSVSGLYTHRACFGITYDNLDIWIDADLPLSIQRKTIAHELAHVAEYIYGFKLREKIIDQVACSIIEGIDSLEPQGA